jgi:hypothetical protein
MNLNDVGLGLLHRMQDKIARAAQEALDKETGVFFKDWVVSSHWRTWAGMSPNGDIPKCRR